MFCLQRNPSVSQPRSGSRATSLSLGTLQVSSYQGVESRGELHIATQKEAEEKNVGQGATKWQSGISQLTSLTGMESQRLKYWWEMSTGQKKSAKVPMSREPSQRAAERENVFSQQLSNGWMQVKKEKRKQGLTSQQIPACLAVTWLLRFLFSSQRVTPGGSVWWAINLSNWEGSLTSPGENVLRFYCGHKHLITVACVDVYFTFHRWNSRQPVMLNYFRELHFPFGFGIRFSSLLAWKLKWHQELDVQHAEAQQKWEPVIPVNGCGSLTVNGKTGILSVNNFIVWLFLLPCSFNVWPPY